MASAPGHTHFVGNAVAARGRCGNRLFFCNDNVAVRETVYKFRMNKLAEQLRRSPSGEIIDLELAKIKFRYEFAIYSPFDRNNPCMQRSMKWSR